MKRVGKDDLHTIDRNEIVDKTDTQGKESVLGDKKSAKPNQQKRKDIDDIKKDTTNAQPMGLDPNSQN
jgi:hypothetical protein